MAVGEVQLKVMFDAEASTGNITSHVVIKQFTVAAPRYSNVKANRTASVHIPVQKPGFHTRAPGNLPIRGWLSTNGVGFPKRSRQQV